MKPMRAKQHSTPSPPQEKKEHITGGLENEAIQAQGNEAINKGGGQVTRRQIPEGSNKTRPHKTTKQGNEQHRLSCQPKQRQVCVVDRVVLLSSGEQQARILLAIGTGAEREIKNRGHVSWNQEENSYWRGRRL